MQLCEPAILLAQLISQSATFVTGYLFPQLSFIDLYRQTGPVCYWLLSPLRTAMSDKDAKRIRRKLLASVSRAVELIDAMQNAKLTGQDTYLRFRDTFYLLIDGVRCENSTEWHGVEVKDLLTRENKAEVQHTR